MILFVVSRPVVQLYLRRDPGAWDCLLQWFALLELKSKYVASNHSRFFLLVPGWSYIDCWDALHKIHATRIARSSEFANNYNVKNKFELHNIFFSRTVLLSMYFMLYFIICFRRSIFNLNTLVGVFYKSRGLYYNWICNLLLRVPKNCVRLPQKTSSTTVCSSVSTNNKSTLDCYVIWRWSKEKHSTMLLCKVFVSEFSYEQLFL